MAHHGHVVSAVADPEAREVLFEGDVENPMNAVLDAPMAAHRIGESGKRTRGDVVTPFEAHLFSLLDLGLDHADDGQPGEAFGAGKGAIRTHPADRPGDLVGANLQPAMGFVEALGDVELLPGGAGE